MKGVTLTARSLMYGGVAGLTLGALLLTAPTKAGDLGTTLIVGEGTGIPGGTVAISISLDGDVEDSVSADLDVAFPTDLVEFIPPVNVNCEIAARLASTHTIGGTLPPPGGLLRFAIFDQQGLTPLGNGELATCNFHILPGAPVGTAALEVDFAQLRNAEGFVPVEGLDGAIFIASEISPTPTATGTPTGTVGPSTPTATRTVGSPTPTNTMIGPTATRTNGGDGTPTSTRTVGTPIATATNTVGTPSGGTPTATRTMDGGPTRTSTAVGPTATNTVGTPSGGTPTATRTGGTGPTPRPEDDGCNVVPAQQSSAGGMLVLLLAPALLIWARRRRF